MPNSPSTQSRLAFPEPLVKATLIRRYKRFLADVELSDGERVTVHCPNTGGMLGCDIPGSEVWLSHSDKPTRKYSRTWELVRPPGGPMIGINTMRTNRIVEAALRAHAIPDLPPATELKREVTLAGLSSRFDFLVPAETDVVIEVKNVTAAVTDGVAVFPDAVSSRATRHLRELMQCVASGLRAVQLYCVQRDDVAAVKPAVDIDPRYAETVLEAKAAGVEFMAWGCEVTPTAITLNRPLKFQPE